MRRLLARAAMIMLTAGAVCLAGGFAAWAYWTASAVTGSSGAAFATSVNTATAPTVSKQSAQNVTVSWPAVTLGNGVAATGYLVKRVDAATSTAQTVLSGCAGTLSTLSCTESAVPAGSWRYSVHAVYGTIWSGPDSPASTTITTGNPVITLSRTVFGSPLPTATTGTLSGFGAGETVTYRLDSSTVLTGSPGVADAAGAATISSLTIPSAADGSHTVTALGGNGSSASTTITIDTTPPAVASAQSPAASATGWSLTNPVSVTLSASDATTSVASIKYTTDGSDPTSSGTAITYSGAFSVSAATTVRYFATDTAGNASTAGSRVIKFDTVAPTNSLTVSGALLSGNTIYYRGTPSGSFTITNAVADAQSGPASSTTSALGGTSTGFSHTPGTVSTPAGGPYPSGAVSWTSGTTSAPSLTVTGADVATNTVTTTLGLVNDSTAPTGGSIDATGLTGTGGRYSTSTTINLAFAKGTDAGVGLASTGTLLQRSAATLSNGVCGTYGAASTIATDPASPRSDTVTDQACYRYSYVVADSLGNTTTYTSGDVKVDTTAPSAPTFTYTPGTATWASAGTVYYRSTAASGSFAVAASSTDAASGIGGIAYPSPLGTNWTGTYSWSGTPGTPTNTTVTVTNNAGLTASAAMGPFVNDTTAPSGGSISYAAGYLSAASVPITWSAGTDAASGISTTLGALQRRSATLASPGGTCGSYGSWATVANPSVSPYTDTTVVNGNCYQYQYVASDNVGNTVTYTGSNTVKAPAFYSCATAVNSLASSGYWRLDDASGTTAVDSSTTTGGANVGTYAGAYSLGVIGVCNSGATFTGADGYVYTTIGVAAPGPNTFSEEIWFKTSVAGGRLLGFGTARNATTSGSYDRHLYMTTDGKINFGLTNDLLTLGLFRYSIASNTALNDNKWHHAAAVLDPAVGMRLYIDGVQQTAVNNSVVQGQNYGAIGYWRVASDSLTGFSNGPRAFSGTLSNAAVYNSTALTAAQVWDHYLAGVVGSTAGLVTAPPSIAASIQSEPGDTPLPPLPSATPSASSSVPPSAPSSASSSVSPSGGMPAPSPAPSAPPLPTSPFPAPMPSPPASTNSPAPTRERAPSPSPSSGSPPTEPPAPTPAAPSDPSPAVVE